MSGLIRAARAPARLAALRPLGIAPPSSLTRRFVATVRDALARRSQRRALREWAEHDERHLLRDIGVTREEARREAAKWFWQR